jgi:arylamine N-acetyltransferase
MRASEIDVQACLERIRYRGPVDVSYRTLRELQQAFMLAVPFENGTTKT